MSVINQPDIEIIHHFFDESDVKGGLGLLATYHRGDSFFRVTTEPCSRQDQYSKKVAVDFLRENMDNGEFIRLPVPRRIRKNMNHADLRKHLLGFGYYSVEF